MNFFLKERVILPLFLLLLAYMMLISSESKVIMAGIAIFLVGMLFMEDGFKQFAGSMLQHLLEKSTNTLPKAMLSGFLITSIVQSSSLVAVITISFLSAEMMGLLQAIGVIFGSNLGTTSTAWIVALFGVKINIAYYAMPMLVFGSVMRVSSSSKTYQGIGTILLGLGFVFLGIAYLKEGFEIIKDVVDLSAFSQEGLFGILLYVAIGTVVTVIIQSSSATMALIITALASANIIYTDALAMAIGANIGTTVTAILGALTSNANGKRLAAAHLIFNIITAFIAIVFIHQLSHIVDTLAHFFSISEENTVLKLAMFHTLFNFIGILAVTPFIKIIVRVLKRLFREEHEHRGEAKYLDKMVIQVESSAIKAIEHETEHLYDVALEALMHGLLLHRHEVFAKETTVYSRQSDVFKVDIDGFYHKRVKGIYAEIIEYSTRAMSGMDEESKRRVYELQVANRDIIEALKHVRELHKNIIIFVEHTNKYIEKEYNFLRMRIADLVGDINQIRVNPDDFSVLQNINMIRDDLKTFDIIGSGRIDELIRHNKIDSHMATSLINDTAFAGVIMMKLLEMASILWIRDVELRALELEEEEEG